MLVADRLPQSYPQIYLFLSLRMADYLYTFHCSPTLWVTFLSYTFILILWEQEHWFTVSLVHPSEEWKLPIGSMVTCLHSYRL